MATQIFIRATTVNLHLGGGSNLHHLEQEIHDMAESQEQAVARLTADVASMRTVEESAKTLLQGLADQLRQSQTDPAAISALADQVEAQIADLSGAVTANTPASSDTGGASTDTGGGSSDTSGAGTDMSGSSGSSEGGAAPADLPPPDDGGDTTAGDGTTVASDPTGASAPAGSDQASDGASALDPTVNAAAGAEATDDQAQDPNP